MSQPEQQSLGSDELSEALLAQRIPVEMYYPESGPGQHEPPEGRAKVVPNGAELHQRHHNDRRANTDHGSGRVVGDGRHEHPQRDQKHRHQQQQRHRDLHLPFQVKLELELKLEPELELQFPYILKPKLRMIYNKLFHHFNTLIVIEIYNIISHSSMAGMFKKLLRHFFK